MKKVLSIMLFIINCLVLTSMTEVQAIEVESAIICQGISNLEAVKPKNSFEALAGRLYCLTKIIGVENPPVTITHVWYYEDTEMARIPLNIGASQWRTYSSKTVLPNQIGTWQVLVLDAQNNVLKSVIFKVTW
ncbi:DUF2914 domain-containing protein [Candidatus Magnetomoraceae bacterium gMMP-1]